MEKGQALSGEFTVMAPAALSAGLREKICRTKPPLQQSVAYRMGDGVASVVSPMLNVGSEVEL